MIQPSLSELQSFFEETWKTPPEKMIFSLPSSNAPYEKVVFSRLGEGYHVERFTSTQVFHENLSLLEGKAKAPEEFHLQYRQANLWTKSHSIQLKISKKGKILLHKTLLKQPPRSLISHNKQKAYVLPEGLIVPPLIDMGILTPEGKVIHSMYHKFRQINRFLEIVTDCLPHLPQDRPISIIDFGCGKSYLTFVLYHYFTEILKKPISMTGIDLKEQVVDKANATAKKYGYTHLSFLQGDIKDHFSDTATDMVISLHACDTATDYALQYAIKEKAKVILAVPCCQHELNEQIHSEAFSILTRYGLVQDRICALFTDAIRANLLTACGYKTQLMEFIDMEHTPKNILLRAYKSSISQKTKKQALQEVETLMQSFSLTPTLQTLLDDTSFLPPIS
ncbi:MAG: SAM-dependent methyltransferase [Clostridiales bacterium]|nr:SAM-dependent methyltransferase [Clostridiales bacterium]